MENIGIADLITNYPNNGVGHDLVRKMREILEDEEMRSRTIIYGAPNGGEWGIEISYIPKDADKEVFNA